LFFSQIVLLLNKKTMKRLICGGLLMLGLNGYLSAQSPGYLGKRFFAKPEIAYTIALSNPTSGNRGGNTYGEQEDRLGFNSRYGLQLGYAFSRRNVVALEGSYMATGMVLTVHTPSVLFEAQSDEHYLFYNLKGPEFGVVLQIYNPSKGSIAPMGFFTALRLRMAFLKGNILDKRTTYFLNDASAGHRPLGIQASYNQLFAGLEFGQNIIIVDQLVLSASCEINVTPLNLSASFAPSEEGNQGAFENAAAYRMKSHSLIMFKIGLGYLF